MLLYLVIVITLIMQNNPLTRQLWKLPSLIMSTNTTIDIDKLKFEQLTNSKPPPLYQVIMLNDDFTTMDFVMEVLMGIFKKPADEAERIMLTIHYQGRGICGLYPKDIAATRIQQVHQLAQLEQHPLKCLMEPSP